MHASLLAPCDPGRLGTIIDIVTVEKSRPEQVRYNHLQSYRGKIATRAG
jgi:hypothetical protein